MRAGRDDKPLSYPHKGCGGELIPRWAESWETERTFETALLGEWYFTCTRCGQKGLIADE